MIFSGSERAVQCIMKKEKDPRKMIAAQKQYYVPGFPDFKNSIMSPDFARKMIAAQQQYYVPGFRISEVFEDFAPVAFVAGASPVTLIHDDEIKEIGAVFPIEAGATLVLGNGLVGGEIHLTALDDFALNLPAGIAEGGELFVLRIVYEDGAVGEVQDAGATRLAGAVPASAPELPADVEGHIRLAGTGWHVDQHMALAAGDCGDDAVDGDLLVIAERLSGHWKAGGKKALLLALIVKPDVGLKSLPKLAGRWECFWSAFFSREEIVLYDPVVIGGIGELEIENLRVFLGLLQPVAGILMGSLGLPAIMRLGR